jgi:hypothetical protein
LIADEAKSEQNAARRRQLELEAADLWCHHRRAP